MKLFISTATDKIYLMQFDEEKIHNQLIYQGKNNHTETLYDLLDELNVDYKNLEAVYIVNGPGSYTGLRVGVIFAKTLAMINQVKIVPVGLMEALYYSNNKQDVCVDAKGKKYYYYNGEKVDLIKADDIAGLIDPEIALDELYNSKYLESLTAVDYLELSIEYIKSAI